MKIGIITLWQSSDNYGQQLQCWALQQALLKLGHEPYLIRYDIDGRINNTKKPLWKKILKIFLLYPLVKKIIRIKKDKDEKELISYNATKNKERRFEEFRNEHILQSDMVYKSLNELRDNPPQADAYIVGSDQVWAHLLSNYENRAMFLDFGDARVKRIAYAPSFSMQQYPIELRQELVDNLSRFNSLSVREKSGGNICKKHGFDVSVVVDPTMLLSKEDYNVLQSNEKNTKYLFLYYLNISNPEDIEWNELKRIAHKEGLKVIATPASGYFPGRELFDGVEYQYATIAQWIHLIESADIVVTTSFHGVVFCILHHTPFIYFPLSGKYSRGNNRIADLCHDLSLSGQIWHQNASLEEMMNNDINWDEVDMNLNNMRNVSQIFLYNSLI